METIPELRIRAALTEAQYKAFCEATESPGITPSRCQLDNPKDLDRRVHSFIDQLLHWEKTPQGHSYWSGIKCSLNQRL